MKKNIFFILFLFSYGIQGWITAQNLVPNGDFEYYTSCPTWSNQIYSAFPWYDPNGATPDYFNACALPTSYMSVPDQLLGVWQYAHSGVAYAGLITGQGFGFGSNYREYIQVLLTDTLIYQKCYAICFYVNLYNKLKYGANNLGAYISQTAVTSIAPSPIPVAPQILLSGNSPIVDTVNWIQISGLYHANGGEQYITIGNFNYDSTTVTQIVDANSSWNAAYYYIDDVSVYEIKTSNAGRDTTVCHGDSVQLGTTNYEGVTYSWQPTTGLSNANIGKPMASPSITTTYYLTQTTPCETTVDTVMVSVCDGVGVNENNKEDMVEVYPNPATNSLTLTFAKGGGTITIYNVLGEIVFTSPNTTHTKEIDISALPSGVYFVRVQNEKQNFYKKFVKE